MMTFSFCYPLCVLPSVCVTLCVLPSLCVTPSDCYPLSAVVFCVVVTYRGYRLLSSLLSSLFSSSLSVLLLPFVCYPLSVTLSVCYPL